MTFVYDIGDIIGLTGLVVGLTAIGFAKAVEALRARRARRRG